jgi:membrane associated rhomboid family serine protease
MTESSPHPLELILNLCAEASPAPWYPAAYVQATGISRENLDPYLDQLRMGGLIQLTDWTSGHGQGYVLTPEGKQVEESPRLRARLRSGSLPVHGQAPLTADEPSDLLPVSWERGEAAREALTKRITPVVTIGLILANVLVFLAGLGLALRAKEPLDAFWMGSTIPVLHQTGALFGEELHNGQWWRLLTCCFVHIGLLHLAVNMYSLYAVGPLLEQLWGSWRFLVLYLIAGLGGSCAMVISNPDVVGAGASGALWGIMGSMGTWLFVNRSVLPPQLVAFWRRQLLQVFLINLFITFSIKSISASAHLGGGAVGLIAALPMDYMRFGRGQQRAVAFGILVAIPLVCVVWAVRTVLEHGPGGAQAAGQQGGIGVDPQLQQQVNQADRHANQVWNERLVPLLFERHPRRRDKEEVQKAQTSAAQVQAELSAVVEKLKNAGPLRNQQQMQRYFEEKAWLFHLADQCLAQGEECKDEEEQSIQAQQLRVKELGRAIQP